MINKKLSILPIALMVLGFSSCLKEGNENIDPSKGTPNVVEFANTGSNVSNTAVSTYPRFAIDLGQLALNETKDFPITLSYSGVDYAPQDITVNLAIDEATLTKFNTENKSGYAAPVSEIFSLPASAVIKKGEKTVTITATIKLTAAYDFNKSYALPIKITSASLGTISGNFGAALYSFSARNSLDGVYSVVSGYVQRYTAPGTPTTDALNGSLTGNPDMTLTTYDANTVELVNMQWSNKGGGVGGIDHTLATLDPATNLVSMSSLGNATLKNWPGKENKYDPATKTYTLNFHWNPTANVREMTLVLKYKGPR